MIGKLWAILIVVIVLGMLVLCSRSEAQTNTVTSTSSTVSGTTTVDRTPSTASAPGIMINNQDVCRTGTSIAIQSQILGLASGTTVRDMNCERLKLSRQLFRFGMKVAAVALLCQDERVFMAMTQAGTICPYEGKIGLDAEKLWKENPEKRPDYERWAKENKIEEEFLSDEDSAILGISGFILLLLLL
jgi:hypothetical protein|tara:strand:+ start:518 stop:1081 length:564 start_codon:yes stop_codon:yes gene_type:complete